MEKREKNERTLRNDERWWCSIIIRYKEKRDRCFLWLPRFSIFSQKDALLNIHSIFRILIFFITWLNSPSIFCHFKSLNVKRRLLETFLYVRSNRVNMKLSFLIVGGGKDEKRIPLFASQVDDNVGVVQEPVIAIRELCGCDNEIFLAIIERGRRHKERRTQPALTTAFSACNHGARTDASTALPHLGTTPLICH